MKDEYEEDEEDWKNWVYDAEIYPYIIYTTGEWKR